MAGRDRRGRRVRKARVNSIEQVPAKPTSKPAGKPTKRSNTEGLESPSRSSSSSSSTSLKPKGPNRMGRPRGTLNKTTVQVKEAINYAYEGMGGHARFLEWANEHPTIFYKLFAKLLPRQITGPNDGPIQFEEIRRTIVDPKIPRRTEKDITPVVIEHEG